MEKAAPLDAARFDGFGEGVRLGQVTNKVDLGAAAWLWGAVSSARASAAIGRVGRGSVREYLTA